MASIAIIGSGPAGCYCAQFLRRSLPDAEITVFDKLPVPYGLIRYGVAPDHQGTKTVSRQFDRLFEQQRVRFAGNIEVGVTTSIAVLRAAYDVIVIASGLYADRPLNIPGDRSPGVVGAGRLTRLINGHPDELWNGAEVGRRVAIIGAGNVAIDVLRLLIKPRAAFVESDISDDTLERIRSGPIEHITLVSRSLPSAAKFDTAMIRELRGTPHVRFDIGAQYGPAEHSPAIGESSKTHALLELTERSDLAARLTVAFRFGWTPQAVRANETSGRVASLELEDPTGLRHRINADTVITAIGFEHCARPIGIDEPWDRDQSTEARLAPGLYQTGWFRRGPRGAIAENRVDARAVAEAVVSDLDVSKAETTKRGWLGLPPAVRNRAVDFTGWRQIDRFELSSATRGRCRQKVIEREKLLTLAECASEQLESPLRRR